jgi:two-component system, cell cycle response regulator DivK
MSGAEGPAARILLVEDNETIRRAFAILLEESGYEVLQAGSGAEAIALSGRLLPDLVLMDLGLPDLHGLEVTRALKADPATSGIAIVAITGRALETDREACLAAGCSGYLAKPIDTRQLLERIPEFLGV